MECEFLFRIRSGRFLGQLLFVLQFFFCSILLANSNKANKTSIGGTHANVTVFTTNSKDFVQKQLNGQVTDENGVSLPGASILEKGTNNGAVSDFDGNYSIIISDANAVLVFSYVGYLDKEITVGNATTVNVQMEVDSEQLDEVVIIGYGAQKKSDLTGAVAGVDSETLEKRPTLNPLDALAGQVAGVNVYNGSGRPGGGFRVQIRGAGSINASNDPLYVIDGFVGGDIDLINPNDIESIDILKDASSTAIYGAQGANGVVIVTTKGAKEGGVTVTFDTNVGFGTLANKIDVLDSEQWLEMRLQLMDDIRAINPGEGPNLLDYDGSVYPNLFTPDGAIFDTDWQDATTQTAFSQRHFLSVSGSTDRFDGGFTVGFQDEGGTLLNTFFKQTTARFFANAKLSDKIKLGGSINFGFTNQNRPDQYRTGAFTPTRLMVEFPSIFPIRNQDGTFSALDDLRRRNGALDIFSGINPVSILTQDLELSFKDTQILGNVYIDLQLGKGLNFRSTYGQQYRTENSLQYISRRFDLFVNQNFANTGNTSQENWQLENVLSYTNTFGKHDVGATLGAAWYSYEQFAFSGTASGFADDFFSYNNLGAGAEPPTVGSSYTSSSLNSYFARGNYTYNNRYLLTATIRYDGSSRFGSENRYAFFPSAALGWRVSEENFLQDSKAITNLKLRASYGQTGNNAIGDYAALGSPGVQSLIFNDVRVVGSSQGAQPNNELRWEKTTETNFGLDLGLFNRVNLTADFYRRETSDLLFQAPVPSFTGYSSVLSNIGAVENKGIEIGLNTVNVDAGDFYWGSTINLTANRNEVLSLGTNDEDVFTGFFFPDRIFRVGEPIASWWGYQRLTAWGTDQVDEAAVYNRIPGDVRVDDVNNDGRYDREDQQILGNPFPDYEIGFTNNFSYKNWNLSVDILISQGAEILNPTVLFINDRYNYGNAYTEFYNKRWTPENQNTIYSRVRPDVKQFNSFDSGHVFDGSYIRGRNLTLSYSFPSTLMEKLRMKNMKLYGNVQNFFLITDYFGADPEVSSNDGDQFAQGLDIYGYPKQRTVIFGVQATF